LICAQAVVHFRPKEVYERYLKLLVGAMVLIQLVLPFGSFLLGGRKEEALRALEQFKWEMEQGVKQAEENAAAADMLLEQMTLEEVRKAVEAQSGQDEEDARRGESQGSEGAWQENPEEMGESAESGAIAVEVEIETVEHVEPVRVGGE